MMSKLRWRHHLLAGTLTASLALTGGIAQVITSASAQAEPCTAIDLVVARGTQEPGYLGQEVGDPLFGALKDVVPSLTAHRVDYPADLLDPWSIGRGSSDIVAHITAQEQACPWQRFVVVGYSQGAVAAHVALGTAIVGWLPGAAVLPPELGDRIAAVLLFGEPLRGIGWHVPDRYFDRTGNFCSPGDPICDRAGNNPAAHVSYGPSLHDAVAFAVSRI